MKQNGMALTARSASPKAMSEISRFNIASVNRTYMTLLTCTKTGRNQCRTHTQYSDDFASLPPHQGHSKDLASFLVETL
jgi:Flp pilus assembly protein TadG